MSYITKPYILFGVGRGFRALTYEIDNNRTLHIKGLTGEIATIPLENAMARREDQVGRVASLFRKVLDIGDVLVAAQGGQHLCKKVSGVQAFIAAVNGTYSLASPSHDTIPDSIWSDLIVPGEVLRAYGNDWSISIFTGKLIEKERPGPRSASRFVDSKSREKRITLVSSEIPNNELHSQMNIGDTLTMAYFSDTAGERGTYFLLYDHKRQREYSLTRHAVFDLSWESSKGWWLEWWTWNLANRFGRSSQYERIRNLVMQRHAL